MELVHFQFKQFGIAGFLPQNMNMNLLTSLGDDLNEDNEEGIFDAPLYIVIALMKNQKKFEATEDELLMALQLYRLEISFELIKRIKGIEFSSPTLKTILKNRKLQVDLGLNSLDERLH